MLDFLGTITVTMAIMLCVNAFITTISPNRTTWLWLAGAAGLWVGLNIAIGSAGQFADAGRRAVPMVGVMFATPLVATIAAAWLSPAFRTALLGIPTTLLIGLNAARVFGGFFLLLAAVGRLDGPFPVSAGWGDVITGVLALPVAALVAQGRGLQTAAWWNAFGALDLVAAIFLGVASSPGSAGATLRCRCRLRGGPVSALGADPDRAGAALADHSWRNLRAAADARGRAPQCGAIKPDLGAPSDVARPGRRTPRQIPRSFQGPDRRRP